MPGDALVTLAVVIGTDIEPVVILPVIPADDLGGSDKRGPVVDLNILVFLYLTITGLGAIVLSFTGMSFDESIGAAVSSMSSYGFGLGDFGPSGNFSTATGFAKYFLSFLMIVGRLEVFTVLSLFTSSLWKK